ncbi:MAG TPA: acetate kinase [Spirochaetota bacterium]|nr:acetate kinase [Spirochaetota bacterium]
MKILVVNAGSSSLKFQLFDARTEDVLIRGNYDGIGLSGTETSCERKIVITGKTERGARAVRDHEGAIGDMLETLRAKSVIDDRSEITAVGHRVVHGGERYRATTLIDKTVTSDLGEIAFLAPLHNPVGIACIKILIHELAGARQYAIFDTAFHQTMPEEAYLYGLPYALYKKFGIRKYGFHGTSHKYVSLKAAEILGRDITELKIVTCHLGNGQSVCAVKHGRSVDTSMGFTPLEGLPMGTRSGSFDPEIIFFLMGHGYTAAAIKRIINKESGLLGLSGISSDHRAIAEAILSGDPNAIRAEKVLINRIVCTIGAYAAEMGGLDSIVFTGGIGENSPSLRRDILQNLSFLGIDFDDEKNRAHGAILTRPGSRVVAMVVPTNEELQIMREVREALDA